MVMNELIIPLLIVLVVFMLDVVGDKSIVDCMVYFCTVCLQSFVMLGFWGRGTGEWIRLD